MPNLNSKIRFHILTQKSFLFVFTENTNGWNFLRRDRISKYGINKGSIRPEQSGFRNRKECISLYPSLRIIFQRPNFENKDTDFAFLDLKKYDSVPIYNLLMKIYHLSIRGKCL